MTSFALLLKNFIAFSYINKVLFYSIFQLFKYISHCVSVIYEENEKKLKKNVADNGKGCTFAPAFGRNEGREKRGDGSEFFESLRPAQDRRRVMRRQG